MSFLFFICLLLSVISTPSLPSPPPDASYARFRPLIGLALFSSRLFPPIAGISLLHNDNNARQSHSLTATPPLFVPRFPDLIPFNPLSRAIFWRLVALLSHH
ncbi:hypothetical protein J3E68DRAFT_412528 [Trichoderma sp. SZMC 28012]